MNGSGELTDLELEAVVGGKAQAQQKRVESVTLKPVATAVKVAAATPTGGCAGGVCRKA